MERESRMIVDPQQEKNKNYKAPWPIKTFDNIGDNYAEGPQIKVKCIDPRGIYYNFCRRREGDVFNLIPQYIPEADPNTMKPVMENGKPKMRLVTAEEQFSSATMERVDEDEPETITTAKDAILKVQNDLDGAKVPAKRK